MKRTILGAVIGAIILFVWQFLSWGVINFHEKAQQHTPNQDAILSSLAANLPEEGGYLLPNVPANATEEEQNKLWEDMEGKPWASIQYHKSHNQSMAMNSIRQIIVNLIIVWLFCWLILKLNIRSFKNIFLSALAVGLIVFLNSPYTGSIWYQWFDTMAHFLDAMVCWGLIGLVIGALFKHKTA